MAEERAAYWDAVYAAKGDREVSWYEDVPRLSVQLIAEAGFGKQAAIVDIGGGTSLLVDTLIAAGQAHVTVLDVSATALEKARLRLAETDRVDWVVSDVTFWSPTRQFDVWHDRAAFHFLTDPNDQAAYAAVMRQALGHGGVAIIGTFAPDGPERCSGLPVARHDAESLAAIFGNGFELIGSLRYEHQTPWGAKQRFHFGTFRRVAD